MKINFIPNLQRDMYHGWDSSQATPVKSKTLSIVNIEKLIGMSTQHYSDGWICTDVSYDLISYKIIFLQKDSDTIMYVTIYRNSFHDFSNFRQFYKVEIRQKVAGVLNEPDEYEVPIDGSHFVSPKNILVYLDKRMEVKKQRTIAQIWKEKPWYKKLSIKANRFIKELIP